MPMPTFRERLAVPLWWWLVAGAFVLSVLVAAGFALGAWPGIVLTVASSALVAAVLVPYGKQRTVVDEHALTVGDSRVEWRWVADARALDADQARLRLGTGADARAHLAVRPYTPQAVEVTIDDPADPHPYWLVGSRHAEELAAAVRAHLAEPREASDVH